MSARPITYTIRHIGGGTFIDNASDMLAELVGAVDNSGKTGKITLEISLTSSPRINPGDSNERLCRMHNIIEVRTSLWTARAERIPSESDTQSMRCHGLPDRHDIRRCIDVPIMARAATWARPITNRQRHLVLDMAAGRTGLAAGKPAVNPFNVLSIPFGLFFKHSDGLPDARIAQRAGNVVVLQHPAQVEVLDVDCVKPLHHASAEFVQRISSTIGNLFMHLGNVLLDVRTTLAAFLAACHLFLIERQTFLPKRAMLRVRHLLASIQRSQPVDTKINTDRIASFWQFNRSSFNHQRNKIFAAGFAHQANRRWFWYGAARPLDLNRTNLGQFQCSGFGIERESVMGIVRGLRGFLALEYRIASALIKEIRVGRLQIAQRLLQANTGNFVEPNRFRLLLENGQRLVRCRITNAFAIAKAIATHTQSPVPDKPHAAERPGKMFLLLWRRITAECPSGFHGSHYRRIICEMQ